MSQRERRLLNQLPSEMSPAASRQRQWRSADVLLKQAAKVAIPHSKFVGQAVETVFVYGAFP
jgi:hypothetical protein